MEIVLYEYQLNILDYLLNLISLFVGGAFLFNSIILVKSKHKEKGWDGFINSFLRLQDSLLL